MGLIKEMQEVARWLLTLPPLPKIVISTVIIGFTSFIIIMIWASPPDAAVKMILSSCYRRALFTRTHAQMDIDSMFKSISECRESVQTRIPEIRKKDHQALAVELLATLYQLERHNPQHNPMGSLIDIEEIDKLKLSAIRHFRKLASTTGGNFPLPDDGKLGQSVFFTKNEADAPPSITEINDATAINPKLVY